MLLSILCWLGGCADEPVPTPRCGDGAVDVDEECDDGDANDDDAPDACRSTCLLPSCGDGVTDGGEACDDGGGSGGDGCDPWCAVETGTLEAEPNDTTAEATPVGATGHGTLGEDDADCFSFDVARCDAVRVTETAPCLGAVTMALHDPTGALLAVGAPGEDGCAAVDPADQPGARWVEAGAWSVCVSAVNGVAVPGYTVAVGVGSSAELDADAGDDLDDDGEPDSCDTDRDGDGVGDAEDTCPDVSNGPDTVLALDDDGYVVTWLGAGPFTGDASTGDCRPAEDARVGEDGEDFAPSPGAAAGDVAWDVNFLSSYHFDLLGYASVDAPREAYGMVYLDSPSARTATLAVGADDGVFAWWNGEQVLDVSSCQGVVADQFQASVEVAEGVNTLLLKVRDQGGGWGLSARLLDADGAAITDLAPLLDPEGAWLPDQADSDGDGTGDVCE